MLQTHLAAGHSSLYHVVRLGLLPSDFLQPFWGVRVDLRYLGLRLFATLLRHGFLYDCAPYVSPCGLLVLRSSQRMGCSGPSAAGGGSTNRGLTLPVSSSPLHTGGSGMKNAVEFPPVRRKIRRDSGNGKRLLPVWTKSLAMHTRETCLHPSPRTAGTKTTLD